LDSRSEGRGFDSH